MLNISPLDEHSSVTTEQIHLQNLLEDIAVIIDLPEGQLELVKNRKNYGFCRQIYRKDQML